jgi:alpha,alpha-trehalase
MSRSQSQIPLRARSRLVVALIIIIVGAHTPGPGAQQSSLDNRELQPILNYISSSWDSLTRSMNDCASIVDPKINAPAILYFPADFPEPSVADQIAADCNVQLKHLPRVIHHLGEIETDKLPPGLLYLENKYVVPGGRFNEMYGWDSYFIARGLLRSGRVELARGMVDNFFFEIEHYGAMLNANRTYYLTRSQPPFLSSMFVELYAALQKSGHADPAWLAKAYTDIQKDYELWVTAPHFAGNTGLSRYYDFGEGPPPEALKDEAGSYRKIATYLFFHPAQADDYLVEVLPEQQNAAHSEEPVPELAQAPPTAGRSFTLQVCDAPPATNPPACDARRTFKLSSDFYKGDRSMRESGFDVSFRFGPFGAGTHHYAPVCLNTLLYKTEKDLAQIAGWLGRTADVKKWNERAEARKKLIVRYLWDSKRGMFFDFNFQTGKRSSYRYATTFYPLWAGLATAEQAQQLVRNLTAFEHPGGLAMSTEETGAQWDLPYGWANIELLAVEGLRRYGFNADANRISYEFLSMVAENFRRDHDIREKYNVVTRSSEVHAEVGYHMNVVGFGWTNAAFLELLRELPRTMVDHLQRAEPNE